MDIKHTIQSINDRARELKRTSLPDTWEVNGGGSDEVTYTRALVRGDGYLFITVASDGCVDVSLWSACQVFDTAIAAWAFPDVITAVRSVELIATFATYCFGEPDARALGLDMGEGE